MTRTYTTVTVNDLSAGDMLVRGNVGVRIDRIDDDEKSYRTVYLFSTKTYDYTPVRMRRSTVVQTVQV